MQGFRDNCTFNGDVGVKLGYEVQQYEKEKYISEDEQNVEAQLPSPVFVSTLLKCPSILLTQTLWKILH